MVHYNFYIFIHSAGLFSAYLDALDALGIMNVEEQALAFLFGSPTDSVGEMLQGTRSGASTPVVKELNETCTFVRSRAFHSANLGKNPNISAKVWPLPCFLPNGRPKDQGCNRKKNKIEKEPEETCSDSGGNTYGYQASNVFWGWIVIENCSVSNFNGAQRRGPVGYWCPSGPCAAQWERKDFIGSFSNAVKDMCSLYNMYAWQLTKSHEVEMVDTLLENVDMVLTDPASTV